MYLLSNENAAEALCTDAVTLHRDTEKQLNFVVGWGVVARKVQLPLAPKVSGTQQPQ